MSLEHILLGMLREPASGYDLGAAFEDSVRHFWSAELSQIYPTLKRLEERGLLESWREPSDRGPEKRVYRTTPEGHEELRGWLRSGPQIHTQRLAYLAQLFFMDELGELGETLEFLEQLREGLAAWLAHLEEAEREIVGPCGGVDGMDDPTFHQYLALRLGVRVVRARVEWCDESIERVRARSRARVGTSEEA